MSNFGEFGQFSLQPDEGAYGGYLRQQQEQQESPVYPYEMKIKYLQ